MRVSEVANSLRPHESRGRAPLPVLFLVVWAALVLLHWPLLRLPYLWDEAYFVTIAHDLLNTGSFIPVSVKSNGHPPLVFAYLASAWKLFGSQPLVTRVAMLAWASFGLVQVFRLGESLGGRRLGIACLVCTGLYPVFFVQGSLAHLDLPAAVLTVAAVRLYFTGRFRGAAMLFTLAVLAKETAILVPSGLLSLEVLERDWKRLRERLGCALAPSAALGSWFAFHWLQTGYVLGNPEFFHENVTATLSSFRFAVALAMRVWHLTGHMHLWALAVPAIWTLWRNRGAKQLMGEFGRSTWLLSAAGAVAFSVVGGALLARYLLLVTPLLICLYLLVLQNHTRHGITLASAAFILFGVALFSPPVIPAAVEDSLAYKEVIETNQRAVELVLKDVQRVEVAASWPLPDLLAKPYLGYAPSPVQVREIAELTVDELRAARSRGDFTIAVLASYNLERSLIDRWSFMDRLRASLGRREYLDFEEAAALLGGRIVREEVRGTAGFVVVEVGAHSDWRDLD